MTETRIRPREGGKRFAVEYRESELETWDTLPFRCRTTDEAVIVAAVFELTLEVDTIIQHRQQKEV